MHIREHWKGLILWLLCCILILVSVFLLSPRAFAQPILMYHNITEDRNGDLYITKKNFIKHLDWIKANGYNIVTFEQLKLGYNLPKMIVLTFDDGKLSQYWAAQELRKRGMVGVFYITTGFLGGKLFLNPKQVREIADWGMEIGSHTISHPNLTKLSREPMRTQFANSKLSLEKIIGKPVLSVAYPYGAYNDKVIYMADECNFIYGRTTNEYITNWWPTNRQTLKLPVVYIHGNIPLSVSLDKSRRY